MQATRNHMKSRNQHNGYTHNERGGGHSHVVIGADANGAHILACLQPSYAMEALRTWSDPQREVCADCAQRLRERAS